MASVTPAEGAGSASSSSSSSSASPAIALDDGAMSQLGEQSRELLDTIDRLRDLRVNDIVELPQLIVVGDQSSGKSSVLEAISRIRFPVKDGLCTRFATELLLRKSIDERIDVRIRKQDGSDDESFQKPSQGFRREELPSIVEAAKEHMGSGTDGTGFSEDILRIELCGPDLPSLTLVDLPGFYHSGSEEQSDMGKEVVQNMVTRYMKQKNSIILAVVSAGNDIVLQQGLNEAKRRDPRRERTLGIITKPDCVSSANRSKFVQLANNHEAAHRLSLGWHVLRNRADGEEGATDDERDANEKAFFSGSSLWGKVDASNLGISALRNKLSSELLSHIQRNLGGVVQEIRRNLHSRQSQLMALGQPRSTPAELRAYLSEISVRFTALARDAVYGHYGDTSFFGSSLNPQPDELVKKLRAHIRQQGRAFVWVLQDRGAAFNLEGGSGRHRSQRTAPPTSLEPFVRNLNRIHKLHRPEEVPDTDFKRWLEKYTATNMGTELPGDIDQNLAYELFKYRSVRWEHIARSHVDIVTQTSMAFIEQLLKHTVADGHTCGSIWRVCVEPFFAERKTKLDEKIQELLLHYRGDYAQQIDSEFLLAIEQRRHSRARHAEESQDSILDLNSTPVVDNMMTYYDLSLRTFTENVMILALENCLIRDLPKMFDAVQVTQFSDAELTELAAEMPAIRELRVKLQREHDILKQGLDECRRHTFHIPSSATRDNSLTDEPSASLAPPAVIAPGQPGPSNGAASAMHAMNPAFPPPFASEEPSQSRTPSLSPTPTQSPPRGRGTRRVSVPESEPMTPPSIAASRSSSSLFSPEAAPTTGIFAQNTRKHSARRLAVRSAHHGEEEEL